MDKILWRYKLLGGKNRKDWGETNKLDKIKYWEDRGEINESDWKRIRIKGEIKTPYLHVTEQQTLT